MSTAAAGLTSADDNDLLRIHVPDADLSGNETRSDFVDHERTRL